MIRRYSKFNHTHRFNRFANRKHIAGPGAGIKLTINPYIENIAQGQIESVESSGEEKYSVKCNIPCILDIKEASSYYYGIEEPLLNVKAVITGFTGVNIVDDDLYIDLNNESELLNAIKDAINWSKTDLTAYYGGGWSHTVFNGELEEVESPGDGSYDDILTVSFKILDDSVIDEIEYYTSGDAYMEQEDSEEFTSARKSYRHSVAGRTYRHSVARRPYRRYSARNFAAKAWTAPDGQKFGRQSRNFPSGFLFTVGELKQMLSDGIAEELKNFDPVKMDYDVIGFSWNRNNGYRSGILIQDNKTGKLLVGNSSDAVKAKY